MAAGLPAQQTVSAQAPVGLHVEVVDENGTAVPSAHITLTPQLGTAVHGETDYAGRKEFSALLPGDYSLQVEKEGFFAVTQPGIAVGEVASAEVTLNHIREFPEQVNVVYSPPAIDPAKTQASHTLNSAEIINLPFPVDRDIRYSLPFIPGVLQDSTGQLHVDGASTRQVYDQIDGFNVSDPAYRPVPDARQRGCRAVCRRGQQPLFHRVRQEFGRCHQPAHRSRATTTGV